MHPSLPTRPSLAARVQHSEMRDTKSVAGAGARAAQPIEALLALAFGQHAGDQGRGHRGLPGV
jgi:hypothetical protein